MSGPKKVAVILAGCGFKDGSEIREAVAVLWSLSRHGAIAECFAPDMEQTDVVNTFTGKTSKNEVRNCLVEAARIARGQIRKLRELNSDEFDAVILPGGYGAAKNLCTFAMQGSKGTVLPHLQKTLQAFYDSERPIGAVCIAPAILALALKGKSIELTVGQKCEASEEIQKLGHSHIVKSASDCHTDEKNKIVSTPAYMYDDAPLHEIFTGIDKLVTQVISLA